MPAERRKKTKTPEDVPERGDPDRKRVLNVLAQRRYRQRRKEKIAALEAKSKGLDPSPADHHCNDNAISFEHALPADSLCDSPPDEAQGIEEIVRNPEDVGFSLMDFGQEPLSVNLFDDFNLYTFPSPLPSPVLSSSTCSNSNLSTQSSSSSPPLFDFPLTPDGAQLGIPILSAIRAFTSIATALNVINHVWNPLYLHTLPPNPPPNLPPNLHPVPAQIAIPHHPFLDTLPWPSVREKLICMFSLPSAVRPPAAQDDEAGLSGPIMRLVQDLDHFQDGVRVHGNMSGWGEGSELVEEAWEVGESFFRNWWWCLDGKVLEVTNRRRRERGLGALRIKA